MGDDLSDFHRTFLHLASGDGGLMPTKLKALEKEQYRPITFHCTAPVLLGLELSLPASVSSQCFFGLVCFFSQKLTVTTMRSDGMSNMCNMRLTMSPCPAGKSLEILKKRTDTVSPPLIHLPSSV